MKRSIFTFSLFFAFYGSCWAQPNPAASEPEDLITTATHEIYRGVTIIRADPVGLTFSYHDSTPALMMKRIKFQDLSDVMQKKYHYDPQRAAAYDLDQQKVVLELKQRLEIDDRIATELNNQRAEEAWEQSTILEQQRLDDGSRMAQQDELQNENVYPWNYFVPVSYGYRHRPCARGRDNPPAFKNNMSHPCHPAASFGSARLSR